MKLLVLTILSVQLDRKPSGYHFHRLLVHIFRQSFEVRHDYSNQSLHE